MRCDDDDDDDEGYPDLGSRHIYILLLMML